MGLLRFLWSWVNPTWAWEEDAGLPLIVDLDACRLCGAGTGDRAEKLSFLGPGKVAPSGFAWPHKGVEVRVNAGLIEELGFFFGHADEPEMGEFAGRFRYRGVPVRLSRETSEPEVRSLFGQPYWRDEDDEEVILFYEIPDCEWQLEFGRGGTLKYLTFGGQLLADAEQRAAYAVTKPWPPKPS